MNKKVSEHNGGGGNDNEKENKEDHTDEAKGQVINNVNPAATCHFDNKLKTRVGRNDALKPCHEFSIVFMV